MNEYIKVIRKNGEFDELLEILKGSDKSDKI